MCVGVDSPSYPAKCALEFTFILAASLDFAWTARERLFNIRCATLGLAVLISRKRGRGGSGGFNFGALVARVWLCGLLLLRRPLVEKGIFSKVTHKEAELRRQVTSLEGRKRAMLVVSVWPLVRKHY